jgi:hypothetical protein
MRHRDAEAIYGDLLHAEPAATEERRAELFAQAQAVAERSRPVAFFDATFSVSRSITLLHASARAMKLAAQEAGDAESAERAQELEDTIWRAISTGAAAGMDLVIQHLLYDPDANGVDKSIRRYFFTVSYGRAALQPTVFDPVTVPDAQPIGLAQASGHAITEAFAGFPAFTNAAAVFAPNPGYGWPDWTFWSGVPVTNVTAFCYNMLNSGVGAWAMEDTHQLTSFGDLYNPLGQPPLPRPGNFDNMDCSCGVHPSTFTKLKLGWLDESDIVDVGAGFTTQTLHALALPRPSPPGRSTAFRIPTGDPQPYFLVEARLRTDVFDAGIPSEGIVIYEVPRQPGRLFSCSPPMRSAWISRSSTPRSRVSVSPSTPR